MTHIESRLLREQIITDAIKGLTMIELSKKYGKTKDYIYNTCQWADIKVKRSNTKILKFNTFLIITELFDCHKTMVQIANEFNITHQRVSQIYQKAMEAKIPGLPKR